MNNISTVTDAENLSAELRCIECGNIESLFDIIYRCSKCDGLLEVSHDISAIQNTTAETWKSIFDQRAGGNSGVWQFREWVLPEIADDSIVSLGEGASPLVSVARLNNDLGIELAIKQCGVSHTGSFKDLGMTVLVSHVRSLISAGKRIRAVACASTGDTSAALSAYASAAGIPTIVFLPAGKISTAQLVQPLSGNSIVISLDTDFDGCMKIVREITRDTSIYLANSMNPLRIEGQKTISFEIARQMSYNVPDWVVIPGGNLGNVSALVSGFSLLKEAGLIDRIPRVCLAQAVHANPLYLSFQSGFNEEKHVSARQTLASAIQIGAPVSYARAVKALKACNGLVEQASEDELSNSAAFYDQYGFFNDPHTGVALACFDKLLRNGSIQKGQKVVIVSTAHGLKFSEFKTGYHENNLEGVEARFQNKPMQLAAEVGTVQNALNETLSVRSEL